MRIIYRARALADIDDIYRYIEQRSPTGARNVVRAIHDSIRAIAEQPYGSVRTNNPDIRVKVVRRYHPLTSCVISAAGVLSAGWTVLHGASTRSIPPRRVRAVALGFC